MSAVTQVTNVLKTTEALKALFERPLAIDTIENPVIDPCGHTFEEKDILQWLVINKFCPLSNEPLIVRDLIPNRIVKQAIEVLKQRNRPINGRIEEQGKDEREQLILQRAMAELRPQTSKRQSKDTVECCYKLQYLEETLEENNKRLDESTSRLERVVRKMSSQLSSTISTTTIFAISALALYILLSNKSKKGWYLPLIGFFSSTFSGKAIK